MTNMDRITQDDFDMIDIIDTLPQGVINLRKFSILMLLHKHGELTFMDIANIYGMNPGAVTSHLRRLEKMNLIGHRKEFYNDGTMKVRTLYFLKGDKWKEARRTLRTLFLEGDY